jgi:glucan 1,3-beta-glucosidase
MVLEPWITPSLFYRFLGKTASEGVGMDAYTFCEALGPEEGNAVMRAHWDSWLDTEHIDNLAERGVEVVRIPIGDWTLTPYGPYVGCMDGAAEKIEWAMDEFAARGIKVLLDVHAIKDSQNGFDNSGQAMNLEWIDETHFKHWTVQNASWMGTYNGYSYEWINQDNIEWALQNVRNLMAKWGNHPALYALEPVNEPWEHSDLPTLK